MRFSLIRAAFTRPKLLLPLLGAAWRFRRRDWYRRPPFLPLPSAEYMRWRMHTAFGNERTEPSAAELEAYLKWSAWMQKNGRT